MKCTAMLLLVAAMAMAVAVNALQEDAAMRAIAPFEHGVGLHCTSHSECGFLPGLACIEGVCDYCQQNSDCSASGKIRRCHVSHTLDHETSEQVPAMGHNAKGELVQAAFCVEKDLFFPFLESDMWGTLFAFLSTALGSGCGVGGGGLLVPAFILVAGLSPKHAIPVSKATIFGNAVAIYWFNLRRKHPLKPHAPVIDYNVASIMEPTTLIGAVIGVMLNHVLPNWLILVMLVTLLTFITYHTYLKGNQIRARETRQRLALVKGALTGRKGGGGRGRAWSVYQAFDWKTAARKWLAITRRNRKLRAQLREDEADFQSLPPLAISSASSEQALPLLQSEKQTTPLTDFGTFGGINGDDSAVAGLRDRIVRHEASIFPLRVVVPLVVCWLVVLVQALLRGGHGSGSLIGVQCNTTDYWLLTILPLLVLVIITWRVGYRLRLENRLKVISGYEFMESDQHWTWSMVTKFPVYCTTAGIAAGLLGIGGGMVKSPIMLEMGILPAVQSATASYMILYTSSSTTLQFAIAGQFPGSLQYDYALWYALVGFVGGLCGQKVVAYFVKKYKRESIVVYMLAVTIGLSAVAMGLVGISNTVHDIEKGANLGFNSLCGNA